MLADISGSTAAFATAVLLCAYTVRGVAGFGSGLIAIPLLALSFPLTLVVPLVVLLDFLGSISQGYKNRAHVEWRELLPLLPFTILGVVLALYLLNSLDATVLQRSLGVFVFVYGAYQLSPLPAIRSTRVSALPYGFLGGMVGTIFGTGGPFYVIYFSMRGLEKLALRASFAIWFIVDGSMRLAGYFAYGFLNANTLQKTAWAIPIAGLGLYIGGRIHSNISQDAFRRIISVLLLLSGCALMLKN